MELIIKRLDPVADIVDNLTKLQDHLNPPAEIGWSIRGKVEEARRSMGEELGNVSRPTTEELIAAAQGKGNIAGVGAMVVKILDLIAKTRKIIQDNLVTDDNHSFISDRASEVLQFLFEGLQKIFQKEAVEVKPA